MEYNSKLNCLFEKWIKESKKNNEWQSEEQTAFTKDGILEKNDPVDVEDLWYNSRKRILFLLKDQPTEWSDDVRLWLKDDESQDDKESLARKRNNRELKSRFIQNIANLFWGLYTIDNPNDCDYSKAQESFEDVKRCFNTIPFALVESKKQGGGTSITPAKLKKYLERYKTFLRNELDILSPNMIVCTHGYIYGFVIDYYNEKYPDSPLRTLEGHNSIRIHPESKTLIFCSYHPSALRFSYETVYMGVMDHYRAFLKSEYFHHFKSWYD
ncbi:MAG: hypothetical protein J1F29_03340 [Lentimicrobiaceae bacterium]|nr:hypothetical protein [Lentimicrobiaceae bacterium]